MSTLQNFSRRSFVKGIFSAGAFVVCGQIAPVRLWAGTLQTLTNPLEGTGFHPNLWLGIEPDGTVIIVAARSEMGTGISTDLPRVVADELEADWKRVKIVQALGAKKYGNQDTDGSHSIRSFFETMRVAGATAREMLVRAAAAQWGVPAADCVAELHEVVHRPALAAGDPPARRLGYGELVATAAKLPLPAPSEVRLKPRKAWRYIGKDDHFRNLKEIVTGTAVYGIDTGMPGMLIASVEHPPVLGGTVVSYDDREALQVPGVKQTVKLETWSGAGVGDQPLGGIAVLADNTWATFQARKKLKIQWNHGPNAGYNSAAYRRQLLETAHKPGKVVRKVGDVEAEFAKGGRIVEASYYAPHLAHAPMEPPAALAEYKDGKVTIWAPTQDPQGLQQAVARALKIGVDDVICHVTLLGGAFGRKSFPDFATEAALLSKHTGKPVKVSWSREDDVQFGTYHSVAGMYMKASLDAAGKPTACLMRSVFPPIGSTYNSKNEYGGGGELSMGWSTVPFDIPNLQVENGPAAGHVRIGWLRSVANIYHSFATNSFAAEMAHAAGRDPYEYLLELLGPARKTDFNGVMRTPPGYEFDAGRLRRVTEIAAEQAGWGRRKMGRGFGMGIAAHWSFLTYVASVVQVEVDEKGQLTIQRVDSAVDAGTVVNPRSVRAQFEGAAVFSTSLAMYGEITATNGKIDQSNFQNYPMSRIKDAPRETHVHIVESTAPPAGVGEPGVPPYAPALCNAIFAATGKRVRELPIANTNLAV